MSKSNQHQHSKHFATVFPMAEQNVFQIDFFSENQLIFTAYNVKSKDLQSVIANFLETGVISWCGLVYREMGQ